MLKQRDRLIAKIKSQSKKETHKYGIQIHRSIHEAIQSDKANISTYWTDAIQLEIFENRVVFNILDQGRNV